MINDEKIRIDNSTMNDGSVHVHIHFDGDLSPDAISTLVRELPNAVWQIGRGLDEKKHSATPGRPAGK